ncbi:MAG: HAD-IB family hydrolase [Acidimicrobiales bacterium]
MFFDLDKTLIPGFSLILLAQGLRERHFYRGDDLVRFAWQEFLFRAGGAERRPALESSRKAALEFVRGRHRGDLEALAREIVADRIMPRVYPTMAEVIERHRAEGDLTFVATAAPVELADIVAKGLGMTGALGTRAEVDDAGRYSGRLAGAVLHGHEKAHAVRAHAVAVGVDLSASVAYSDSIHDLPMLELVGDAQAVNPDRKLRDLAEARGWPVHELRPVRARRRRVSGGAVTASSATRRRPPSPPVCDRLEALGLSAYVRQVADSSPNSRSSYFTVEDPDALVRELEQSGRFRRDTRLGAIFHPGQISLREVAPLNSLHISIGEGKRVSAHIDRYSPLSSNQPEGRCRYSLPRIAAHNVAGIVADVFRLLPGRRH